VLSTLIRLSPREPMEPAAMDTNQVGHITATIKTDPTCDDGSRHFAGTHTMRSFARVMVLAAKRGGCIEMLTLASGLPEDETLALIRENADVLAKECAEYDTKINTAQKAQVRKSAHRAKRLREIEPWRKIVDSVRGQVAYALKRTGTVKSLGLFRHFGYSPAELKSHLEEKMTDGMSWENYGSVWHIDHVRPVSRFDFSGDNTETVIKECWKLSNLQPLFARDNLTKSNKYEG
jgi:hypothetical protein